MTESISSYCPQFPLRNHGIHLAYGLSVGKNALACIAVIVGGLYVVSAVKALLPPPRKGKQRAVLVMLEEGSESGLRGQSETRASEESGLAGPLTYQTRAETPRFDNPASRMEIIR